MVGKLAGGHPGAFLHGRPIICSDIGGMAEKVRNRVDGLHFRVASAESLVDRLTEVLQNQISGSGFAAASAALSRLQMLRSSTLRFTANCWRAVPARRRRSLGR